jgi:transcription initiation factor TFIIF subunit beta
MIVLQESIERKKKELKKAREDKEVVIDLLFNAFEQHQYYTFKDLCEITQQPDSYLKEILKEIGHYNYKAPHKNMWELKDEYRIKRQATSTNDSQ